MDAIFEGEEADYCQRAEWKGLRLWIGREAGGGSSFLLLIVLAERPRFLPFTVYRRMQAWATVSGKVR
jgi:hypothetical protein